MGPLTFLARFVRHLVPKHGLAKTTPRWRFVSRLTVDQVEHAAEEVIGRRLLVSELSALEEGFRPLSGPDDEYAARLASPRYLGRAVVLFVRALGARGYGRDEDRTLELVEYGIVTLETPGVNDPVIVVD